MPRLSRGHSNRNPLRRPASSSPQTIGRRSTFTRALFTPWIPCCLKAPSLARPNPILFNSLHRLQNLALASISPTSRIPLRSIATFGQRAIMDRFPRFRRHKKDAVVPAAPPTSTGAPPVSPTDTKAAGNRTPSPGSQTLPVPPPPSRDRPSRSPFRGLHLRSSAKRARESPPGSLPQSPNASFLVADGNNGHIRSPLSAPLPSRRSTGNTVSTTRNGTPKIPAFLDLTDQSKLRHSGEGESLVSSYGVVLPC